MPFEIFEDAWNDCGHPQTLLEYVYYLTQGIPLRARISEQIDSLDGVNASLLQYVSVSNLYREIFLRMPFGICVIFLL